MKKTVFQAVAFSVIVHLFVVGFQLVKGNWLTKSYQPNVTKAYDQVDVLQNEVTFGVINNESGIFLMVISFCVGVISFFIGKLLFKKLLKG